MKVTFLCVPFLSVPALLIKGNHDNWSLIVYYEVRLKNAAPLKTAFEIITHYFE